MVPITDTQHNREPTPSEDEELRESERREGENAPEKSGRAEVGQPSQSENSAQRGRTKGLAGGVAIFALLGMYFVWIGNEMGSHASSGTFEMWAIFGAIFLGVAALVAGGAMSRRKRD